MKKLSPARRTFLTDARKGIHAVEGYAPAKWALDNGYVTITEGKWGRRVHTITPAGEAVLSS